TNASVSLARLYQPLAGYYASEGLADLLVRHRNSVRWNSTALSGINLHEYSHSLDYWPDWQIIRFAGSLHIKTAGWGVAGGLLLWTFT
ncbi:MAG TPA: hypothetical protein PL160_05640, partial [Candidatus Cloacimonas sp.]|nr:hypothetical protein [Candidatus Cloacimonas sp.]